MYKIKIKYVLIRKIGNLLLPTYKQKYNVTNNGEKKEE